MVQSQNIRQDIDYMDLGARQENLHARGEPIMLQLCVVPAYSLTVRYPIVNSRRLLFIERFSSRFDCKKPPIQVHKTQALSIKHLVLGCLEGVFALGQVYVLVSRVTDPQNFTLVGIPPRDLIEDLAQALLREGIDVDSFFEKACQVSGEWKYDHSKARLVDRIEQRFSHERSVPLRFRTLVECLNPQPDAHVVFQRLLDWIDRCDLASQTGAPRPAFQTISGEQIFPSDDDPWWLTDISRRLSTDAKREGDEDGPATEGEEEGEQGEVTDEDPVSESEQVGTAVSSQQKMDLPWSRRV